MINFSFPDNKFPETATKGQNIFIQHLGFDFGFIYNGESWDFDPVVTQKRILTFKLRDEVYTLIGMKAQKCIIRKIKYELDAGSFSVDRNEKDVYASKEQLRDSI
jgi:hypothetical protein